MHWTVVIVGAVVGCRVTGFWVGVCSVGRFVGDRTTVVGAGTGAGTDEEGTGTGAGTGAVGTGTGAVGTGASSSSI